MRGNVLGNALTAESLENRGSCWRPKHQVLNNKGGEPGSRRLQQTRPRQFLGSRSLPDLAEVTTLMKTQLEEIYH